MKGNDQLLTVSIQIPVLTLQVRIEKIEILLLSFLDALVCRKINTAEYFLPLF